MVARLASVGLVVFGSSIIIAGCGGKPAGGGASGEPPTAPDPKATAAAVEAVQTKLPAGVTIAFEAVNGERDRHLAVQPKGWETGVIPGRVKPPMGSNLGFMTAFSTGTNCDGACSPKDWAAIADKVEFQQFAGKSIAKDEKLPDGRLMVINGDNRVDIALARWKEGADHYFTCRATLDRELVGAADAFEEACRQMKPLSWEH